MFETLFSFLFPQTVEFCEFQLRYQKISYLQVERPILENDSKKD